MKLNMPKTKTPTKQWTTKPIATPIPFAEPKPRVKISRAKGKMCRVTLKFAIEWPLGDNSARDEAARLVGRLCSVVEPTERAKLVDELRSAGEAYTREHGNKSKSGATN